MQRKIVLQVVLALCLLAGIGAAVFFLFSDKKSGSKGFDNTLERGLALAEGTEYPGLAAVPMDAVMVASPGFFAVIFPFASTESTEGLLLFQLIWSDGILILKLRS